MSVLLYQSGVLEQYLPKNLVFDEEELVYLFLDFDKIVTKRVYELPNTWMLWGTYKNPQETEYNKIPSKLIQERIYTPVLFIHDSELNPDWNSTDTILYDNYDTFKTNTLAFLKEYNAEINEYNNSVNNRNEDEEIPSETGQLKLTNVGITNDKRILFNFDPTSQVDNFYTTENFNTFSLNIFKYFQEYPPQDPLVILSDNNMVITVDSPNGCFLFDKLIENFTKSENYEICSELVKMKKSYKKLLKEANQTLKENNGN